MLVEYIAIGVFIGGFILGENWRNEWNDRSKPVMILIMVMLSIFWPVTLGGIFVLHLVRIMENVK